MQTVEFIYDKSKRRPKKLQNNVFVLLSSERIRLQPGESKKLDMKHAHSYQRYAKKDSNWKTVIKFRQIITQLNQHVNLPWKLQFELVNRSLNTVSSIRKKQELAFITPLNEGIEELRIKNMKIFFTI